MYKDLFKRRGLSLDRLRALTEVVEAGSIAAATGPDASRQSQYSRQLKELEAFFGTELTVRRGKLLVANRFGADLARITREYFSSLQDFVSATHDQPLSYRIGAGASLIQWLILNRLNPSAPLFKSIKFEIKNLTTTDIVTMLGEFRLDFGLARKDRIPGHLEHRRLGLLKYALFLPLGLAGTIQSTRDVFSQRVPLALLDENSSWGEKMHLLLARHKSKANVRLACSSLTEACAAVKAGHYAAVLPMLAEGALIKDTYRILEWAPLKSLQAEICLAWNPRLFRMRPNAEKVTEYLNNILSFK